MAGLTPGQAPEEEYDSSLSKTPGKAPGLKEDSMKEDFIEDNYMWFLIIILKFV